MLGAGYTGRASDLDAEAARAAEQLRALAEAARDAAEAGRADAEDFRLWAEEGRRNSADARGDRDSQLIAEMRQRIEALERLVAEIRKSRGEA